MKLRQNSITARLYRWFYNTNEYDMPQNLCPYFWKLVVMWIFIVPFTIIVTPLIVVRQEEDIRSERNSGLRLLFGLMSWFVVYILISMVYAPISLSIWGHIKDSMLQHVGIISWAAAIILVISAGITYGISRYRNYKNNQHSKYIWSEDECDYIKNPEYIEPRANIIIEFVKAKYNKYCPKIDWE